jgi:hypothetical protein
MLVDLYSVMKTLAGKAGSLCINLGSVLPVYEKLAQRGIGGRQNEARMRAELSALVDTGRCVMVNDTTVFLVGLCRDRVLQAYSDPEKNTDMPFPSCESMGLTVSPKSLKSVYLNYDDMGGFFDQSLNLADGEGGDMGKAASPGIDEPIKLIFPDEFGSTLLIASMSPRRLMEIALFKVRCYLSSRNNRDYLLNKLYVHMPGKEIFLRDIVNLFMEKPLDCLAEMEKSSDLPYLFWTHFCPLVKYNVNQKKDFLSEDIAIMQAITIVEVCAVFYRNIAARKREISSAFQSLEMYMDQPPWYYTLNQIAGFENEREIPLLRIYSQKALETYIQRAITESKNNFLPAWLLLPVVRGAERSFIKKERYLPLCAKLIAETKPPVKEEIKKRWIKMIREFEKEPAMEKDHEFDKLLAEYMESTNPFLASLLADPKFFLVYAEMNSGPEELPPALRFIHDGRLLPMSVLYSFRRQDFISAARFSLPFWYSVPTLVAIFAFFRRLRKKKKRQIEDAVSGEAGPEQQSIQQSARLIAESILPQGKLLDAYLAELGDRWSQILDKKARNKLIEDVRFLVKNSLHRAQRFYFASRLTRESLDEIADFIVTRTPQLRSLGDQHSLRLYMVLYMLKLLIETKK